MRLYPKKDNVHRPHFFEGTGDCGPRHEVSLGTLHLHPTLLHGAKMRPSREEGGIEPGLRHACADVGPIAPAPATRNLIVGHSSAQRRLRLGEFFRSQWLGYFSPDRSSLDICTLPATRGFCRFVVSPGQQELMHRGHSRIPCHAMFLHRPPKRKRLNLVGTTTVPPEGRVAIVEPINP